jgi:hypothetical protein
MYIQMSYILSFLDVRKNNCSYCFQWALHSHETSDIADIRNRKLTSCGHIQNDVLREQSQAIYRTHCSHEYYSD